MSQDYFLLDGTMYHKSLIRMVSVDGGTNGHGCWGEILLEGMEEPAPIGDGSYADDHKHVDHRVASWDFWRLRFIMRSLLGKNEAGRRLEPDEGYEISEEEAK